MFQEKINALLSTNLYNIDCPRRYIHRFVSHNSSDNDLNLYALGKIKLTTPSSILQAISYNTFDDYDTWNVKPTSLFMFDEGKQVISDQLCEKIIKNIKPDFHECIEKVMMDYFILFDDDGITPIKYENYPLIYKAMGYIYSFPITYFHHDFSTLEMDEITKYLRGQVFIVDLPHSIKLYYHINMGKYESTELSKDVKGIISAVLYVNNEPKDVIEEWINTLTNDEEKLEELTSIIL